MPRQKQNQFKGRKKPLPFARPDITEREAAEVRAALFSGWLTAGPRTRDFEARFAEYVGARHAVAVNSCTAALHLALAANDFGPDDAAFVPAWTFAATAEVLTYSGALPLLLDVNRHDYLLDPDIVTQYIQKKCRFEKGRLIHQATGKHIRAMLPVHYGGRPCRMKELRRIARKYRLLIIEDAAHSFPAGYGGRPIGSSTRDVAAFSFYATKNMTTGEGGMLTTGSARIARRVREMRLHGIRGQTFGRSRWHYDIVDQGFKYNMTDPAAALGLIQLDRAEAMKARRKEIHDIYDREFAGLPGIRLNPSTAHDSAYHLYTIELGRGAQLRRDDFVEAMYALGVAVSLHFIPIYRMSYYKRTYKWKKSDFPNCEAIFASIVSLPLYSAMSDGDVGDVVAAVRSLLAG